ERTSSRRFADARNGRQARRARTDSCPGTGARARNDRHLRHARRPRCGKPRRNCTRGGLPRAVGGLKMADMLELELRQVAAALKDKKLSPVEVTKAALARIAEQQPKINAFVCLTEERALAAAR